MKIKVKKLSRTAKLPRKMTEGSIGFDIFSDQSIVIREGETVRISTGIALALPKNVEAQIRPRSGLAANEYISIIGSPSTIDSDYRGEISVLLYKYPIAKFLDPNCKKTTYEILHGDRIAQIVFQRVPKVILVLTKGHLKKTKRYAGGFGHTGR